MNNELSPLGLFKKVMFTDYFNINGRAPRREYWWYIAISLIIYFLLNIFASVFNYIFHTNLIYNIVSIYILLTVIPTITVGVRRLHDIGRTGWWWLANLVPGFGWVILLFFYCTDSEIGANKFGINPKIKW
ncbi:DUF805 domain-containing protein [Salmonella enterica]|nr:DUF805 domain-containing protein [Salmonella enterica]EAX3609440.1 DUF805 domain-containing protein [Salmonella enterica]EGW6282985.1 DUF805 domain-containing protein [Salmonella enterica]EGX3935401.1 DUF805 domain-containing protein [Salmonella enterica]